MTHRLLLIFPLLLIQAPIHTACKNDSGIVGVDEKEDEEDDAEADRKPRGKRGSEDDAGATDPDDDTNDDTSSSDDGDADDHDGSSSNDDDDASSDDASGNDDTSNDDDGTLDDDGVDFGDDDAVPEPVPSPEGGTGGAASASGGTGGGAGSPGAGGSAPGGAGGTPAVVSGCEVNIVDDFSSCDARICEQDGREGVWFSFAGDGIGLDADQDGVLYPPSDWIDESCGMILAGGAIDGETEFYAGVGLNLSGAYPYDLSTYTGVRFVLETSALLDFTLRTAADEYFISSSPAGNTAGSQEFTVPFASLVPRSDTLTENPGAELNLTLIKEFQWTVQAPEYGFGLAIHRVELY